MINIKDIYDYKDGGLYWKSTTSNAIKVGDRAGYVTSHGYRKIHFLDKQEYEHRLVYLWHHGYIPKEIDHINGNKLDNRIENLREVTHSQNAMNVKLKKNNTSGVKGVCWDKTRNKWKVKVSINNKTINCGRYDDFELAELVAIEARDKYHRQFVKYD
jgi:hypothetical protein